MTLALIIDIAVLLAMVLAFLGLWRTQKTLRDLRQHYKDFSRQTETMNSSILRAQEILGDLKEVASERGQRLQERIDKAYALADELEVMLQSGNRLADRLEKARPQVTAEMPKPSEAESTAAANKVLAQKKDKAKPQAAKQSRTEAKLAEALKKKSAGKGGA